MRRINLVIGFTPFHAVFAEKLICHLEGESFGLFTKGWPSNKGLGRLGGFSGRNRFLRGASYFLSFIYFTFWVRRELWRGTELHVYMPHPSSIFSNFLFFSERVSSINIYEDGLLNYYDADASKGNLGFGLRFVSLLLGAPFRSYEGHLAGYDVRKINCLYVSRAKDVVAREKVDSVIQLTLDYPSLDLVKGRVLFLDQDTSSFFAVKERQELIARMFEMYPPEYYQYFYKGHHDYKGSVDGMVVLEGRLVGLPAEILMAELGFEVVVSFFSSALLNIATAFPVVNCVALAADYVEISRDGKPSTLREVFNSCGVVCLAKGEA